MSSAREVPDWVTLGADESVVWSGHPSFYPVAMSLVVGAVLFVLGPISTVFLPDPWRLVGVVLVVAGLALIGWTYLSHRSTQYVITSNEVYKKTGLVSRQVTSLRMGRIQNTTFTQSFPQRLLSYGDVHIDTAGSGATEIVFESVTDPQRVSRLLTEQLDSHAAAV
ncbi:PH domain-containing protein [Halomarina ordinaria]|uniref:PH domain-containing protein n=1 Tax=Halomarina ordinaria TaxID=3033939 RepID=A0ABD5UBC2_9EURY|nr:PH domain-containing protein [Halomarina sp. PSRA2]